MKEEFLKELKDLLKKYNASIGFDCSDCSDTYGIYDGGIEITMNNKQIKKISCWQLDASDL